MSVEDLFFFRAEYAMGPGGPGHAHKVPGMRTVSGQSFKISASPWGIVVGEKRSTFSE